MFEAFYDDRGPAPMCGFDVFFGEIVATYLDSDCIVDGEPDPALIDPLFVIGTRYFGVGEPVGRVYREGRAYKERLAGGQ